MPRNRRGRNHGTLAHANETYYPYSGNLIHHNEPFEGRERVFTEGIGMPYRGADRNTRDEYHGYSDEGRNSRRMKSMNYPLEGAGYENFEYMEPRYNDYDARGASQEGYGNYWREGMTGPSWVDLKHNYTGPGHGAPPHHWQHHHHLRPMGERYEIYEEGRPFGVEMHYHHYAPEDYGYYDEFGRGVGTMPHRPYAPVRQYRRRRPR